VHTFSNVSRPFSEAWHARFFFLCLLAQLPRSAVSGTAATNVFDGKRLRNLFVPTLPVLLFAVFRKPKAGLN
jgi:hypothetical protein